VVKNGQHHDSISQKIQQPDQMPPAKTTSTYSVLSILYALRGYIILFGKTHCKPPLAFIRSCQEKHETSRVFSPLPAV